MTSYAKIGSISSGTMRPEDLIPAFMDALDDIRERISLDARTADMVVWCKDTVSRLDDVMGAIEGRIANDDNYYSSEDCMDDLNDLTELLQEFAPDMCTFGTHPGDGADWGFFPDWDSIENECCNGYIVKVNAGDEWPEDEIRERLDAGCLRYIVSTNDHGNVTLYTPDGQEIWSVV